MIHRHTCKQNINNTQKFSFRSMLFCFTSRNHPLSYIQGNVLRHTHTLLITRAPTIYFTSTTFLLAQNQAQITSLLSSTGDTSCSCKRVFPVPDAVFMPYIHCTHQLYEGPSVILHPPHTGKLSLSKVTYPRWARITRGQLTPGT